MGNIADYNIKLFYGFVSDFNVRYCHVLRAMMYLLLDVQVYEWCDIKPEIFTPLFPLLQYSLPDE